MESDYIAWHLSSARGAKKSADRNLRSPDGYREGVAVRVIRCGKIGLCDGFELPHLNERFLAFPAALSTSGKDDLSAAKI